MTAETENPAAYQADDPHAPPHNIEAEQALLGALLFDNEAFLRGPVSKPYPGEEIGVHDTFGLPR